MHVKGGEEVVIRGRWRAVGGGGEWDAGSSEMWAAVGGEEE